MTKSVTLLVDENLLERLNAFATINKTDRSKVIKNAIQMLFQKGEIIVLDELSGRLIPITFKLDEDVLMRLDALAIKYRLSRSALIRIAVSQYLKQKENKEANQQAKVEKLTSLR